MRRLLCWLLGHDPAIVCMWVKTGNVVSRRPVRLCARCGLPVAILGGQQP